MWFLKVQSKIVHSTLGIPIGRRHKGQTVHKCRSGLTASLDSPAPNILQQLNQRGRLITLQRECRRLRYALVFVGLAPAGWPTRFDLRCKAHFGTAPCSTDVPFQPISRQSVVVLALLSKNNTCGSMCLLRFLFSVECSLRQICRRGLITR